MLKEFIEITATTASRCFEFQDPAIPIRWRWWGGRTPEWSLVISGIISRLFRVELPNKLSSVEKDKRTLNDHFDKAHQISDEQVCMHNLWSAESCFWTGIFLFPSGVSCSDSSLLLKGEKVHIWRRRAESCDHSNGDKDKGLSHIKWFYSSVCHYFITNRDHILN